MARPGALRAGVQDALVELQPLIDQLGKLPALPTRPEASGWADVLRRATAAARQASDRQDDALLRAIAEMREASDRQDDALLRASAWAAVLRLATAEMREANGRLDDLLRATGQLRSELEATSWQDAEEVVGRAKALTDRLIAEADLHGLPEQVAFAQLARRIGMHHRDSPLTRSFRQVVDPPEAAQMRLLRFLALADRVFDDGSATLDRVTNLRRLADLVLAARGPAGGPDEATLAGLRAEAGRQLGVPLRGADLAQRVRDLVAQVGQAKRAKQQAAAGVAGKAAGRVTRRDLEALRRAARLMRQARRHLDAEIDLDADGRAALIWGLVDGLVTDDVREAVIDLLFATPEEDLDRLFAAPRWLARRLARVIRPSHPMRVRLDDWVTERYGPGMRLSDLGWASVFLAKSPRNREFSPPMVSESLSKLAVGDDVSAERLTQARTATRGPSSEAIIRRLGLSRQRSGNGPSQHDRGLAYLRGLDEAAERSVRIEAARNGEIDLDTDQLRDLAVAALEGVARWQAPKVLRLLHGTEMEAILDDLIPVLNRRIPDTHPSKEAIIKTIFKWIDPETGDQYPNARPLVPFSLDMISENLHGVALRADRTRGRLILIGRELTETDEEIKARIDLESPREQAKLGWWLREEGDVARDVHRAQRHLSADWNAELSLADREPLIARLADGPAAWQAHELLADMDSHELATMFPDGARGALWDRLTSAIPAADLPAFQDERFGADGAVRMDVQPPLPFRPGMISGALTGQKPGTEMTREEALDTADVTAGRSIDEILGSLGLRPREQKTGRLWLGDFHHAIVDLAVRRWSGNTAFQLGTGDLDRLIGHLLALLEHRPAGPATDRTGPAADRVRRVLIATLQSMNASELAEIYHRELRSRLESAIPYGSLRVQLDWFFHGRLDADGQVRMDVQPARTFGWELIDPNLVRQAAGDPLNYYQVRIAEYGIAEKTESELIAALSELDPQQRAVAAWVLTDLRVELHDMSMPDRDYNDGMESAIARLDRVLDWLYSGLLQRIPDAAWLPDLTSTPPASQRQRLREALSPPALVQSAGGPGSSFRYQFPDEAETFRQKLEQALGDDIADLHRTRVESDIAGEKYDLDGHIGPMAALAQEWFGEALGPSAPNPVPVVTAQPGQDVTAGDINVYDMSAHQRWEIANQPDSKVRTEWARLFMTFTLPLHGQSTRKVLAQHHANPQFDSNAVARNEESRIVEDTIKDLLENEEFRDRVLDVRTHWPAGAHQQSIYVSLEKKPGPEGNPQLEAQANQSNLYGTAQRILGGMWRVKASDGYNTFITSLPGEHERNTASDGIPGRLTEWAWNNVRRRLDSDPDYYQRVRSVVEGQEYARQMALDELPDPAVTQRNASHAAVVQVIRQTGFLNLIEAVLNDPRKIIGPGPGSSRPSLLAPGGTAAASSWLPARVATPESISLTVAETPSEPPSQPSTPRSPSPASLSPRPVSPEPLSSHLPPPREQARTAAPAGQPAAAQAPQQRDSPWISPSTGARYIGSAELADGRLRPTTPAG
jgi:hypothetical protein